MGNYRSRPSNSCADELKKKISEGMSDGGSAHKYTHSGYSVLRSRLGDDLKAREQQWTPFQSAV
jgi:hypothetical protein